MNDFNIAETIITCLFVMIILILIACALGWALRKCAFQDEREEELHERLRNINDHGCYTGPDHQKSLYHEHNTTSRSLGNSRVHCIRPGTIIGRVASKEKRAGKDGPATESNDFSS